MGGAGQAGDYLASPTWRRMPVVAQIALAAEAVVILIALYLIWRWRP